MAYTITDQDVCNELQMHLLETPNSGASYGSSLYTGAEVASLITNRMQDMYVMASIVTNVDNSILATPNVRQQDCPADLIDIVRLGFAEA